MILPALPPRFLATLYRFNDVQWSPDGHALFWSEGRGKQTLLRVWEGQPAARDLFRDLSLRPGVGYGGGEFGVGPGFVVFVANGRLYRQDLPHGLPRPITPAFGGFASPTVSPDGRWVLFVHTCEDVDVLAGVPADGSQWPRILARGADFYMQPTWHPAMDYVAWVEWNFPQMPWDGTRLMLARWDRGRFADVQHLAGDEDTPVFQPAFSPNGRYLAYLIQEGDRDALYLYDLSTGTRRPLVTDRVMLPPAWVQGLRTFTWLDDETLVALENRRGWTRVLVVNLEGVVREIDPAPYTWLRQPAGTGDGRRVAFLASAPRIPERVVVWDAARGGSDASFTVLARASSEHLPPSILPEPRPISWVNDEGETVHALYYPPTSTNAESPSPAIVSVHGGPTSQRVANFNAQAAFFTSRGYAYVELNYRGSTGYGRRYMLALRERWGEVDVADAVSLARHLAREGLADGRRLAIMGGSAGGYTVLNTLIRHPDVFRVGIALFPVTDLFALDRETHKFERRYTARLVGSLPEAAAKYRAWSPLYQADRLRTPIALFQGSEDKVVPPNQAERLVEALRRNRVPHVFRLYEGEGHGFRKPETLEDLYTTILHFLEEHL